MVVGSPSLEKSRTQWDVSLEFDLNDESLTHLTLKLTRLSREAWTFRGFLQLYSLSDSTKSLEYSETLALLCSLALQ